MKVLRSLTPAGERIVALGMFDGVHRGHQALLGEALKAAGKLGIPLRACTFDRHPLEIVRPERAPGLLTTLPEKAERMARCGVHELLVIPFGPVEADMEPEDFLSFLRASVRLRGVTAGWNYTFGRGGRGDAELLQRDGRKHGYRVMIVDAVKTETGDVVSSSLIREKLGEGNVSIASQLLGYDYGMTGKAEKTEEGFLLHPHPRKILPLPGEYPCRFRTGRSEERGLVRIPGSREAGILLLPDPNAVPPREGDSLWIGPESPESLNTMA